MLGYDDKRNFFRMMINSPCEVKLLGEGKTVTALCRDISATGMSLEVSVASVDVGTEVEVTIESTSAQLSALKARADVVRCESLSADTCTIGVAVTEMN